MLYNKIIIELIRKKRIIKSNWVIQRTDLEVDLEWTQKSIIECSYWPYIYMYICIYVCCHWFNFIRGSTFIFGLPVRAMANQKMEATLTLQHKEKMVDGTPRRLCISYSSFTGSNFCSKGTGDFRLSGKQIWKSIWTNTELLQKVIGPISTPNDYLNTVFNDIVSLCESCRNSATSGSPREKL